MSCGDDVDLAIASQFFDELVDQARFNERFVALDVDDVGKVFPLFCNLRDPVGAALMKQRSQRHFRAPFKSRMCDTHVVSRDDDRVELGGAAASFPNATQQWFAGDEMQRLAAKTRRSPARRNNSNRFIHVWHSQSRSP